MQLFSVSWMGYVTEPQFSHLQNGNDVTHLKGPVARILVASPGTCRCWVNVSHPRKPECPEGLHTQKCPPDPWPNRPTPHRPPELFESLHIAHQTPTLATKIPYMMHEFLVPPVLGSPSPTFPHPTKTGPTSQNHRTLWGGRGATAVLQEKQDLEP